MVAIVEAGNARLKIENEGSTVLVTLDNFPWGVAALRVDREQFERAVAREMGV